MNSRFFKVTVILILSFALLVCATASYAKYSKTDNSQAEVVTRKQFYKKTFTEQGSGDYLEFEADYDGYYAIIVKGGNGGNGNSGSNSSWQTRKNAEGQTGGYGGVMYGIFSTDDTRYLRISLGSAGTDATGSKTSGTAGVNSTGFLTLPSGLANTVAKGAPGKNYSPAFGGGSNAGSGGSGAGSVVYAYPNRPADHSGASLAIIAGGGGGSAGWDKYYSSGGSGFGGSGGSNFKTTNNNVAISLSNYTADGGKAFSGFNGTEQSNVSTYGRGGSTSNAIAGGSTGTVGTKGTAGRNFITGSGGLPGSFSGNGAEVTGNTCGGPGGGGYAGGGSGGWNGAGRYVGGGGGGSSYIASSMAVENYNNSGLLEEIYDYMHQTAGYNPLDISNTKNSNGYVIIMYLGNNGTENETLLNDATSELYKGRHTSNNVIHATAKNTGYYAIIAKGGNGGNGYQYNGNSGGIRKTYYGGSGGITTSYAYITAGTVFSVYTGSTGGTPVPTGGGTRTAVGTAGTNGASRGEGATGANYASGNGSNMTMNIASGGGGAATIISTGSVSTVSNILAIAAGGGGSASWDEGMNGYMGLITTRPCGGGGHGGTNIPGNTLGQATSNVASGGWNGLVIHGGNGFIDNSYPDPKDSKGKGGTTTGGAAGTSSLITYLVQTVYGATATAGKAPSAYGDGGAGAQHGGGGGGGYAGGGGGSGTSINYSAGGGGGGSSFIKTGTGFGALTDSAKISEIIGRAGIDVNDTRGFYIIAFLGESEPTP